MPRVGGIFIYEGVITMIYKIGTVAQFEAVKDKLPPKVYGEAYRNADILDSEYGADRNVDKDLGGYLLIAEMAGDVKEIDKTHFDISRSIAKNVEVIQGFGVALFILSSYYAVVAILPYEIATENIINAINRRD